MSIDLDSEIYQRHEWRVISGDGIDPQLTAQLRMLSGKVDTTTMYAILRVLRDNPVDGLSSKLFNDFLLTVKLVYAEEISTEISRLSDHIAINIKRELDDIATKKILAELKVAAAKIEAKTGSKPSYAEVRKLETEIRNRQPMPITDRDKKLSLMDKIFAGLAYEFSDEETKTLQELKISHGLDIEKHGFIQTKFRFTDTERARTERQRITETRTDFR